MNAVLLKELRQSVRNRYVLAAYVIFIVVLLIVTGVQISLFIRNAWANPQSVFGTGRALFLAIHGIFAGIAMLFIPCYVASRILRERWGANLDLMYVTPMPPSHLPIGKFGSAMALAGLFLGGALPFLVLSSFIGGIDVLSIVVSVLLTLLVVATLTLFFIVLSIVPMPKILRGVIMLGPVFSLFWAVAGWIAATAELCSEGYVSILGNADSCITFVEAVAMGLSAMGLLYVAALAGFQSPNVDRMRPFRWLATALVVGWGIVVAIQSRFEGYKDSPEPWVAMVMIFAVFMMILGLGERTEMGAYQRKQLPRSLIGRIAGYPFRTGQLNAVCWSVLLLAIGLALSYVIFPAASTVEEYCSKCGATHLLPCDATMAEHFRILTLNVSGYALTMLALWRYVFHRAKMPGAALWWVTALVIILVNIVLGSLSNAGGASDIEGFVGYLFANKREVLPWLYGWNAVAILCLVPVYLGAGKRTTF